MIASKGGMIDLGEWDGNLKRSKVSGDWHLQTTHNIYFQVSEKLKLEQRKLLYQHLARTTSLDATKQ